VVASEEISGGDVIWRWDMRENSTTWSIVIGFIAFFMALFAAVSITSNGLITLAVSLVTAFITAIVVYYKLGVRSIALTHEGLLITDVRGNVIFIPKDKAVDRMCISGPTVEDKYSLYINKNKCKNSIGYRVFISESDLARLQEALSRAWGGVIRYC
jgi:hypothetical protein